MMQTKTARGPSGDHLLIRSITSADGRAIDVGTVTVLLGKNNSGKSELLRDLLRLAANVEPGGQSREQDEELPTKVIQDLAFVSKLTVDRLVRGLTVVADESGEQRVVQGIGPDLKSPCRRKLGSEIKNVLYRPLMTARSVRTTAVGDLMPLRVAYLPSEQRKELLAPAMVCSPARPPENLLQALRYAQASVSEELDAAFASVFPGLHVRLDTTEQIHLYLRIAQEFPQLDSDPIRAVQQYAGLRRADEEGDGYRACLAVVLSMLLAQGRVILIDQPELSLHPEQARRLGLWISSSAPRLGCQVFLATHSVALLRGLVEGCPDVTILRLTRTGNTTMIQPVPAEIASALARSPVLASQHALDGLFRDGAILVSGVEDCVLYETVANQFLDAGNLRFLHAHGVHNLGALTKIVRRANIPTCVIAELDVLQTETAFSELVQAVTGDPPPAPWLATRERLAKQVEGMFSERELSASAHEVESFLEQFQRGTSSESLTTPTPPPVDTRQKWARLQREQLGCLPQELRVWVEELLDELKHKGLFVSPQGGGQGWMPADSPAADRPSWFAKAIQSLQRGECPADLHAFVSDVVAHLRAIAPPLRALRPRQNA